jgi:hypothetical protein
VELELNRTKKKNSLSAKSFIQVRRFSVDVSDNSRWRIIVLGVDNLLGESHGQFPALKKYNPGSEGNVLTSRSPMKAVKSLVGSSLTIFAGFDCFCSRQVLKLRCSEDAKKMS